MNNRSFLLPNQHGHVLFLDNVLQHIYKHAQKCLWHREAGGLLFSSAPQKSPVVISMVTGPHRRDTRSRHLFVPDLYSSTNDCQIQFDLGKYPVGLWHTHPQANPSPSNQDYSTTREYLDAFQGTMDGFLLVILGNRGKPLNMSVWLAITKPTNTWVKLEEI